MSRTADAVRAVRVGALMLVAIALLAGGIWLLGDTSRVWSPKVEYSVSFSNVQGLAPGSTVSLAGYRIGTVRGLVLPQDITEGMVVIRLAVERENRRYIRADTRARIKTIGLLGDKYIELSPGTPAAPELEPGSEIVAVQPPNLDSILEQGESVADNFVKLTANLTKLTERLDKGQGLLGTLISDSEQGRRLTTDLSGMLTNLRSVTQKVDSGDGMAAVLINDKQSAERLRQTIASVSRAAQLLDSGEGLVPRMLKDKEFADQVTSNIEAASRDMSELMRKLNEGKGLFQKLTLDPAYAEQVSRDIGEITGSFAEIARRVAEGEGSLGKLITDETLYEGVNDILAGARKSRLLRWFVTRSQKSGVEQRKARSEAAPAAVPTLTPVNLGEPGR